MSLLDKLFKRGGQSKNSAEKETPSISKNDSTNQKPSSPTRTLPNKKTERELMLDEEKAAMAMPDFDEAAKTLSALYNSWTDKGLTMYVGGYNYIEGKKDSCWVINQYLSGNKEYNDKRIYELVRYHEGFPRDDFHIGSLVVIKWASERVMTDFKDRSGGSK